MNSYKSSGQVLLRIESFLHQISQELMSFVWLSSEVAASVQGLGEYDGIGVRSTFEQLANECWRKRVVLLLAHFDTRHGNLAAPVALGADPTVILQGYSSVVASEGTNDTDFAFGFLGHSPFDFGLGSNLGAV